MKLLIIATRNNGKLKEFRDLMEAIGLDETIHSLEEYPELPEVEETGQSFEENARLKAETIAELTGEIVLADDSGLVVPSLDGEPGIYSARYSGTNATDQTNNQKLLKELAQCAPHQREAYFVSCIVVSAKGVDSLVVEGRVNGEILHEPKGLDGFGYDPLFYYEPKEKTFAQMTMAEKNELSHRGRAIQSLKQKLPIWLKENEDHEVFNNE
ncbi:XTP/dITP diphosphatase [Aerococcaceae bacterium DSM 111020]|nr:XTP/dITP diphosphatase [Aerococcaceae bacterium DSM 111020]